METRDELLYLSDDDRYGRLRLISWWNQERLAASKVLVVGAGALGNEVLKNLALVGVGDIYVIDYDRIDSSNLSRSVLFRMEDSGKYKVEVAADVIGRMNPEIRIHALRGNIMTDVGLGLFADMDVVVGCLDNREARLWVNRSCWKVGTPWVDGGIQEISGVVKVFRPPDSACYECAMSEMDYKLINLKYSCPLLRREDILQGKVPTAPTISSIIAGLQSQEALKILHDMPVKYGSGLVFSGETNQFYTTNFQRRPACLSHETYLDPVDLDLSSDTATLDDLVAEVRDRFGGIPTLQLDRDLLVGVRCPGCGFDKEIFRPVTQVGMEEARCPKCHEIGQTEIVYTVEPDDRFRKRTLIQLGVPPYDIVKLTYEAETRFFRLAGDRKRYSGSSS